MKLTLLLTALCATVSMASGPASIDFLTRQPTPPSSRVVDKDTIHLGWFDRPFQNPSVRTGLLHRPLRTKGWQYVSLTSRRYAIGMSTVNVGYISNFFLFIYDYQTGTYAEFENMSPLGLRASIAPNSLSGTSSYRSAQCRLEIDNHYDSSYYLVRLDCSNKANRITGTVKLHVQGDPLVNIRAVAPRRLVYTHQSAIYRPQGTVVFNQDTIVFDPASDFSSFDYTRGRHLYHTRWNWASAGGTTALGDPVAITFSTATGYFCWHNGNLTRFPALSFSYSSPDSLWTLSTPDSSIDLSFTPAGKRVGNTNVLGLLVSQYTQPFGAFRGTISLPGGQSITLDSLRGVTEEHLAKW